jgi:hypothetical protein
MERHAETKYLRLQDDSDMTISHKMRNAARAAQKFLSSESKSAIIDFVMGQMNPDGGFRGRTQDSDLYYTLFGLECLEALNHPLPYDEFSGYLRLFDDGSGLDFIHLCCYARCLAKLPEGLQKRQNDHAILRQLEPYRTTEAGGYRLLLDSAHDSIYASFLAVLAHEDLGLTITHPKWILHALESLRTGDDGYADQPGLSNGTTTVTAAAAVLLNHFHEHGNDTLSDWLLDHYRSHGGFVATTDTPIPDLLSTATALFALHCLGVSLESIRDRTLMFIESLWHENDGFCGHIADGTPDCEYTFYGLLSLGILASH